MTSELTETRIIDDQDQPLPDESADSRHPPRTTHPAPIRNRIKCHRKVRAGDLVPHEWNFRSHPFAQKAALSSIYQEVGFARSLLAFELPDGRLKLIDGHLRRDRDPDMLVDVEILDVTEDEARKLLLTIDPLAAILYRASDTNELRTLIGSVSLGRAVVSPPSVTTVGVISSPLSVDSPVRARSG